MSDLGELGLSSYEEKAYRALIALGPATAREVSEASDVPMGRIYDVLNGLDAREVVRTQPSTEPTTYAAVDPAVAIDRLLAERKRELDAKAARYEQVADAVASELAATTPTKSRFWSASLDGEAARSYRARGSNTNGYP
jgi:sugar-specific transcriptional regulator TrmB